MLQYSIRPIQAQEVPQLEDFLYEAIYQREGEPLVPRSVLLQPDLQVYIEGFGREGDTCLVALVDGKIVGAVWTRILAGTVKGFGNIDATTPEFAISIYKEYRGNGIGTSLMLHMLALLKEKGYARASLAVQKDNYAARMYKKVGFSVIGENELEFIMACDLEKWLLPKLEQ